jgi:SAM-dependent methyltransferase
VTSGGAEVSSTAFWSRNQVGGPYLTLEESQQALDLREAQFPDLYRLMPVDHPGKTVLDYGCGPGHDTLLFCQRQAKHVFYFDISPMALEIVGARLDMHGLDEKASPVTTDDLPNVDHVHCAGVLHHTENPLEILEQLRSALKAGGDARVMVYDGDVSPHTQSEVPITTWWTREEFVSLAASAGFDATYVDSYECSAEWRPECYAACYLLT